MRRARGGGPAHRRLAGALPGTARPPWNWSTSSRRSRIGCGSRRCRPGRAGRRSGGGLAGDGRGGARHGGAAHAQSADRGDARGPPGVEPVRRRAGDAVAGRPSRTGGSACETRMDPAWLTRGAALLARYEELAAAHRRCTKHRRTRENMAILRTALQDAVDGRPWVTRGRGLAQHALDLHDSQARPARDPGARRAAGGRSRPRWPRCRPITRWPGSSWPGWPRSGRTPEPATVVALIAPVTAEETIRGTAYPRVPRSPGPSLRWCGQQSGAGTVEELIAAGVVPSAEILARLVPQIAATTTAAAYRDEALRSVDGGDLPGLPQPAVAAAGSTCSTRSGWTSCRGYGRWGRTGRRATALAAMRRRPCAGSAS